MGLEFLNTERHESRVDLFFFSRDWPLFRLFGLVWFNGTSSFVVYLMSKASLLKDISDTI